MVVPHANTCRLFSSRHGAEISPVTMKDHSGFRNAVGENMKYLVHTCDGRPLACLLFGAAAWQCRARDAWINWDAAARQRKLFQWANNTRVLVLPRVQVAHRAS